MDDTIAITASDNNIARNGSAKCSFENDESVEGLEFILSMLKVMEENVDEHSIT